MEEKRCESFIDDHDCNLCVTMVGWLDALDSDQGDFRHWHAVDISSCLCLCIHLFIILPCNQFFHLTFS